MLEKISEIQSTLEELEAQRIHLEQALAEAKVAAREHVVQAIRDMIAGAGFTSDEILPLVAPQTTKTAKVKSDGRSFPTYALASDPTKTYVRGVLPTWMKDAMVAAGLDPSQGADRASFKSGWMVQVADTR